WSPNVHVFRSDVPESFDLQPGFTIWGAAFKAPHNWDNFFTRFKDHPSVNDVNIGLFHASERSLFFQQDKDKQQYSSFSAVEISRAGLAHALLGHYHTPIDGEGYTYPGNPEPLTFGEGSEGGAVRGAVLLEIHNDGSFTRERVPVSEIPLHTFRIEV